MLCREHHKKQSETLKLESCWFNLKFMFHSFPSNNCILVSHKVIPKPKQNTASVSMAFFPWSIDNNLTSKITYYL